MEDDEHRRKRKYWQYLRQTGQPSRVHPWEFEKVQDKINSWRAAGLSMQQIGDVCGIAESRVHQVIHDGQQSMMRSNYNRVMAAEFVSVEELHGFGVRRDPLGATRRIQAMFAAGYGPEWQAQYLGRSTSNVRRIMSGITTRIHMQIDDEIRTMFDKLVQVDPVTMGMPEYVALRAQRWARKRLFAPDWAWDDDTIDDPNALPEWTGVCGTARGYRIHLDNDLLVIGIKGKRVVQCERCVEARKAFGSGNAPAFDRVEMMELFDRGKSSAEVAVELGISEITLRRARKEIMDATQDHGG